MGPQHEKEMFLAALRANRHDAITRKIFADWLEEYGEDDLAVIHRRWTPAKEHAAEAWLRHYAAECEMSYEELIDAARRYIANGAGYCVGVMTPDIVFDGAGEFWEHFDVVTDSDVAPKRRGETFIHCAC
jgi:uncharacterized protein (TIGR02996 family)